MHKINNNKTGYVIIYNKKPKKLKHKKLQKRFNKLLLKLEKQKKENYIYTGKFVE